MNYKAELEYLKPNFETYRFDFLMIGDDLGYLEYVLQYFYQEQPTTEIKGGISPIFSKPFFEEDELWIDDIKPEEKIQIFKEICSTCSFEKLKAMSDLFLDYYEDGLDFMIISPHIKNRNKRLKEKEWH